jgi:tRNA modification GTPase
MTHQPIQAEDTIVALATLPGRAALGVVRVSGPATRQVLGRVFRRRAPATRLLVRRPMLGEFLASDGGLIDEGLVLLYAAPASYTGEDLAECTLHGSTAVLRAFISACRAAGARPAEPGEFTLRAFRAGKLDLAQAEAVADLIDATTAEQARVAARQLRGEVGNAIAPLAEAAFDLLADVEASLDFADGEADLGLAGADAAQRIDVIVSQLQRVLGASDSARRVREGARVVLLGPPNAGKSSLFNALLGRDRAIVSTEPGTTRDLVEEIMVIDGLPIVLVDAAGVDDVPTGAADAEGMRRARDAAAGADLVLSVYDGSSAWRPQALGFAVATHADLPLAAPLVENSISVSSVTGAGIDALIAILAERLHAPGAAPIESVALATERHRAAAEAAIAALQNARELALTNAGGELVAVELRAAIGALHSILGNVGTEVLLGRIFSRFCIGK